ncbi:MAG: YbhB/YbcL family Raf kinase inhibitor-like protein, partial [Actinomycetales bacterium]|nr:YbhB/YbcL family Raf kinase inhibitor-like protein [Actinomycetales bacterium]
AFTLSSTDFTDGSELAEEFTADAFSGQCRGENRNPALSWEGAPVGTVSFAVTMVDISAGDFVHWVHAGIPAEVTSVDSGAAGELPGVAGQSATGQFGYFGPCPPTPDHEYVFTVHALDVDPGLATGFRFADLAPFLAEHSLASVSITGVRSGPAL